MHDIFYKDNRMFLMISYLTDIGREKEVNLTLRNFAVSFCKGTRVS